MATFCKKHAFKTACFWINNRSFPQSNDMTRKTTKFCFSWPNNTLEISRRLRNITILLTERTIMSHLNLILPLSPLFYRMWRHFLVDDPNTKKVPGIAECSPPPLPDDPFARRRFARFLSRFAHSRPQSLRFFWSRGRRNDILRRVALGREW